MRSPRERNGRRPQNRHSFRRLRRCRACANLHEEEGSLRVTVTLFQTGLHPMKGRLKLGSITCFAQVKEEESTYDEREYGPLESRVRYTVAMDDSSGPRMWSTGVLPLSSSLLRLASEPWCGRRGDRAAGAPKNRAEQPRRLWYWFLQRASFECRCCVSCTAPPTVSKSR